jgi:xylan 1,4-beta-xylosidase
MDRTGARQGLLNQVRYNSNDKPTADYPVNKSFTAPNLSSSGIPWMVPKSDFFTSDKLNPEWSHLGYTPDNLYSLTDQPGWLRLSPKSGKINTVIKNDGEHNYSLITRLVFNAKGFSDEAGLIILRGDEKSNVKLYISMNEVRHNTVFFSFNSNNYKAEITEGDTVWLKMIRVNHNISGYFSSNGIDWIKVGQNFDISTIDSYSDLSTFTGTRQGLYVQNSAAYFDFYIYRDAYTPILAECPANQYGTTISSKVSGISSLDDIHNNDWALFAGIEFGNSEYVKNPDSLTITASCASAGGVVEVWLDSLDSGTKIAECNIGNTGSWTTYATFTADVLAPVSGRHDVYLKFKGSGSAKLFLLQWLFFKDKSHPETSTSVGELQSSQLPKRFELGQNYPNPFNPTTNISFNLPLKSFVSLKIFDLLGREVAILINEEMSAGTYSWQWSATKMSSGIYFYQMQAGSFTDTKKLILLK